MSEREFMHPEAFGESVEDMQNFQGDPSEAIDPGRGKRGEDDPGLAPDNDALLAPVLGKDPGQRRIDPPEEELPPSEP